MCVSRYRLMAMVAKFDNHKISVRFSKLCNMKKHKILVKSSTI